MKEKSVKELIELTQEQSKGAYYELGKRAYYGTNGLEKNNEEAYRYFSTGAKLGCIYCKYGLARCYFYGAGVAQNLEKAYELLTFVVENSKNDSLTQRASKFLNELEFVDGKITIKNIDKNNNKIN